MSEQARDYGDPGDESDYVQETFLDIMPDGTVIDIDDEDLKALVEQVEISRRVVAERHLLPPELVEHHEKLLSNWGVVSTRATFDTEESLNEYPRELNQRVIPPKFIESRWVGEPEDWEDKENEGL